MCVYLFVINSISNQYYKSKEKGEKKDSNTKELYVHLPVNTFFFFFWRSASKYFSLGEESLCLS